MDKLLKLTLITSVALSFSVELERRTLSEPVTDIHHMQEQTRRLQSDQFTISLENHANLAYVGPIFVGTPLQGSNLTSYIYDTGSGYLTVPSASCVTCSPSFKYSTSASTTYQD